eukprot:scaffold152615_cov21-Tisochrysis_lutea.AAC.4
MHSFLPAAKIVLACIGVPALAALSSGLCLLALRSICSSLACPSAGSVLCSLALRQQRSWCRSKSNQVHCAGASRQPRCATHKASVSSWQQQYGRDGQMIPTIIKVGMP